MKRGAEKQLSKDDADEEEEEQTGTGFVKANDVTLSARKIRALPRRSMAGSPAPTPPTSAPPTPETKPKFGGFSGFGSNAGSFTFSAPDSPSPSKSIDEDYNAAFDFYKSIRGLNVSFSSFLAKALEEDCFADFGQVFDQYNIKRRKIQSVWDKHLTGSLAQPPQNNASLGQNTSASGLFGAPTAPLKPAVPEVFMPAPPASFAGFFNKPIASEAPSTLKGGFTPTITPSSKPSSGFSFPTSSPSGPPAPTFSIGSSTKSPEADPKPTETKSSFSFTSEPKPTSTFGGSSNLFGSGSSNLFGGGSTPTKSTNLFGTPEKPTGNLFGAPNPDKPSPFGGFGASDKPATNNSTFGSGFASKPFAGFGNIGSGSTTPTGSLGNPVGFGFGSPPRTPPPATGESSSAKPGGFTFGGGSSFGAGSSAITESVSKPSGGDASGEAVEEVDHAKILSPTSVHDQEGEGEEDEDTTHSVKAKVYKLTKLDGAATWSDMGIGLLRVKKHHTADSRRLLLRNSSTGKLVINFNVHSGMKPSSSKQTVSFMGHDDSGSAVPFRLRVKTEAFAIELKDALDREVEWAKSK